MKLRELNSNMFYAAFHLAEAGKYMLDIDRERAMKMLIDAEMILSVIEPEEEKVPKERLKSIMDEIMNIKVGK